MVGTMLLGAWLLIQQLQCCVQGKAPLLVDPLTRRSPLDKNFMRFGRSEQLRIDAPDSAPPLPIDEKGFEVKKIVKTNFMRFGRDGSRWLSTDSEGMPRQVRGSERTVRNQGRQDNFIRLGREGGCGFGRPGRSPNQNFIRLGRAKRESRESGEGRETRPLGQLCRALYSEERPDCPAGGCASSPSYHPLYRTLQDLLLPPQFGLLPSPHYDLKPKRSKYNKNFIRLG